MSAQEVWLRGAVCCAGGACTSWHSHQQAAAAGEFPGRKTLHYTQEVGSVSQGAVLNIYVDWGECCTMLECVTQSCCGGCCLFWWLQWGRLGFYLHSSQDGGPGSHVRQVGPLPVHAALTALEPRPPQPSPRVQLTAGSDVH